MIIAIWTLLATYAQITLGASYAYSIAQSAYTYSASGLNTALQMTTKAADQMKKGLKTPKPQELIEVESLEVSKLPLESITLKNDKECPKQFPEPSRLPELIISRVCETLQQIQQIPIPTNFVDFSIVSKNYVFYRHLSENQTLLAVRSPPRYDETESRYARVKWYYDFVDRILPDTIDFIKRHNERQFIFSGVGNSASIALLLSWQCYVKTPQINSCGGHDNSKNQIAVIMFGAPDTVTKSAHFKLGHRNVIRFSDYERPSSTFQTVGFHYTVPSDTLGLSSRQFGIDETYKILSDEPDWSAAYMKTNRASVNALGSSRLSFQHRQAQYFKAVSTETFMSTHKKYVNRDMIAIANRLKSLLDHELKIDPSDQSSISCSIEDHDFDAKYGRIFCEINSSINNDFFNFKIATYELVYGDNDDIMQTSLSQRVKKETTHTVSEWEQCLKELFTQSSALKIIDPSSQKSAFKIDYNHEHTSEIGNRALIRVASSSDDLKNLLDYSMPLFRELVKGVGLFDKPIPNICEKFIKPVAIANSLKGNADALFGSIGKLIKEIDESSKNTKKATIEETNTYRIIDFWSSIPAVGAHDAEVLELPSSLMPLIPNLRKCLDSNSSSLLYNCKDKANLSTGRGFCPLACKTYSMHICTRIKPCGDGIYVGFRNGGIFSLMSSADQEFSKKVRLNPDESQMLSICFVEKIGAAKYSYLTVFIDPQVSKKSFLLKELYSRLKSKRLRQNDTSTTNSSDEENSDSQSPADTAKNGTNGNQSNTNS